ncbi:hypothetical protein HJC23_000776 [Cyclotella cryptica]|uniref:Peptidase M12B domain-containing protein n=1 Tax=Cyclotella cryptica TaxID=29204 RepID=A0ABD3PZW1_9STRA|eukprot:CCRYP_010165-RA/>CCRYP_010165-RA protein AED:0.17 eAED:0.20 QI:0/-1/0/1/-1/1/1/0/305
MTHEQESSPSHVEEHSRWKKYQSSVDQHRQSILSTRPGWFSLPPEERFYQQCLSCPLDELTRSQMPFLVLPLRIHLLRSTNSTLGCSSDLNEESIKSMVRQMNSYWEQARIRFQLLSSTHENGILEHNLDPLIPKHIQREAKHFIEHDLTRGPDGRMQNRSKRKDLYLHTLLRPLKYDKSTTYNVYFFDMTGNGSQGVCISREHRVVIMGERSTKGYPLPTKRPHGCLAKTMAHELGHALGLDHPAGRTFRDGRRQCMEREERENLMKGGADRRGGGGSYLESWQICLAREEASGFLKGCTLENQ